MSKPNLRALRILLVLLLALALSAVYASSAQSTPLTQTAATSDGQISIRLPDGWSEQDYTDSASGYSSFLAFSDSTASPQGAFNRINTGKVGALTGLSGAVAIVAPNSLPAADPIANELNILSLPVFLDKGQFGEQQTIRVGGQYMATTVVADDTTYQQKAIEGVFQAGTNLVVFWIQGSPESAFATNGTMFVDMLESIRLPAEGGSSAVEPTTSPGVVNSPGGLFSVQLPPHYVTGPVTNNLFGDALAFGSSRTGEQAIASVLGQGGKGLQSFAGVAGLIGEPAPGLIPGKSMSRLVAPMMQALLGGLQTSLVTVVQQPQAHTFGGLYTGQLVELNVGFVGIFYSGQQLVIVILVSDNVDLHRSEMNTILDSIRLTTGEQLQPTVTVIPGATPSEMPAASDVQTSRSSDGRVSLDIPSSWTVLDHVADDNVLAYGDSDAAAASRLSAAKPDLAAQTPISGNGGLIILYPMAQFGIDAQNPDLNPLMQRVLSNLSGYAVEQQPQPLEGGGVVAVISGAERGYLALIPFGDQIAYVTATGTPGSFDANAILLRNILKSVHIPATNVSSGLGGLQVTPRPTPKGRS